MNKDNTVHNRKAAVDINQESSQSRKRRNYKKELQAAVAEKEDLRDKLLRTAADFDNYRKRAQQEKLELYESANADLIRRLLPVLDDLDRFADAGNAGADDPLSQGVGLIRKNLAKILQDTGLQEMATKGALFDPSKHDALMLVDADGVEPHTIVEEHQKGYEFKNKILRHAKVIVSKEKE
jgi:molecular chaperone GrpE